MSLAELEQQPSPRVCFDPRFVTSNPNYNPRIINHDGASTQIHDYNSLPLVLNTYFLLEMGLEPESRGGYDHGKNYTERIRSEPVMQEALRALKEEDPGLYEAAAYAVYLHNQEYDESSGWGQNIRTLDNQDVIAHQGIDPASDELRAQKDYDLSCVYVFLSDKARQLEPTYNIDNFRD
jgi:hypothetical protein